MYQFFIFTADLNPWRTHRVFSACRAFAKMIDPTYNAQALYLDQQRVGWTFFFDDDADRRRLATFFNGLTKRVAAEQEQGDPVIQGGYDAAAALQ